jgi:hypothetical protein
MNQRVISIRQKGCERLSAVQTVCTASQYDYFSSPDSCRSRLHAGKSVHLNRLQIKMKTLLLRSQGTGFKQGDCYYNIENDLFHNPDFFAKMASSGQLVKEIAMMNIMSRQDEGSERRMSPETY